MTRLFRYALVPEEGNNTARTLAEPAAGVVGGRRVPGQLADLGSGATIRNVLPPGSVDAQRGFPAACVCRILDLDRLVGGRSEIDRSDQNEE